MKKINGTAANHRESSRKVSLSELKKSGVVRDNLVFKKGDKLVFPEELDAWLETFVPKGSAEAKEYFLITIELNGRSYDASMTSFRRTRNVAEELVDTALTTEPNRILHSLGDDEQRANYLAGKTFEVEDVQWLENRYDSKRKVQVPFFKEVNE